MRKWGIRALAGLAAGALVFAATAQMRGTELEAQNQSSDMAQRLDQVIDVLDRRNCGGIGGALDDGMEVLYGGLRPLPAPGVPESGPADQAVGEMELRLAEALEDFVRSKKCGEHAPRAMDLKLFIEQMNEVARAVGDTTQNCGQGDSLDNPPCDQLKPLLEEEQAVQDATIGPGFGVLLRSPAVARWGHDWREVVETTEPIGLDECASVFKESRGLGVRLVYDRVTLVADPWVSTFGVPRGTAVPIWRLEWVAVEYVKRWDLCRDDGGIADTVTQRVIVDGPLNFFWRQFG